MRIEYKVRALPTPEHLKERFAEYIRQKEAVYNSDATGRDGRNDVYKDAEPVIRSMMNIFYGLNLKMEGKCNASGFDLYDESQNVMVQVTHNQDKPEKVKNCLRTTSQRVTDENLGKPKLYIVFLDKETVKELAASTKRKMQQDGQGNVRGRYDFPITVDFDPENNILNLDSFLIMLQNDQDPDGKALTSEVKWKLVEFISSQGILVDIPGNMQRIILPPLPLNEKNPFTLAMFRDALEYVVDEPFEDDGDFLDQVFDGRIAEYLKVEANLPVEDIMAGKLKNSHRKKIIDLLRDRMDVRNELLENAYAFSIGRDRLTEVYDILCDGLGEVGSYLYECGIHCKINERLYAGVAILAVYALLTPGMFELLVGETIEAEKFFYQLC